MARSFPACRRRSTLLRFARVWTADESPCRGFLRTAGRCVAAREAAQRILRQHHHSGSHSSRRYGPLGDGGSTDVAMERERCCEPRHVGCRNAVATATDNAEVSSVHRTNSGLAWTSLNTHCHCRFLRMSRWRNLFFGSRTWQYGSGSVAGRIDLPAASYDLRIDGKAIANLESRRSGEGREPCCVVTPMLGQARGVALLEERRMKQDAARFSLIAEDPLVPGGGYAAKNTSSRIGCGQETDSAWTRRRSRITLS